MVAARCCPAQVKSASGPTWWRQGVVLLRQRDQAGQLGGGKALSCSGKETKQANTVAARCCPAQAKRASRPTWWRQGVVLLRQREQVSQRGGGEVLSCSAKESKQANAVAARCCPAQPKRASRPTRWRRGVVLLRSKELVGQHGGGKVLSCSVKESKQANLVAARRCPAQAKRASGPTWWRQGVVLLSQR